MLRYVCDGENIVKIYRWFYSHCDRNDKMDKFFFFGFFFYIIHSPHGMGSTPNCHGIDENGN